MRLILASTIAVAAFALPALAQTPTAPAAKPATPAPQSVPLGANPKSVASEFAIKPPPQAANHVLSRNDLVKVGDHSWTIKGFPNVGIVVGRTATLVIDTGMGAKNGKIVADIALSLSHPGNKLYLTTTHYHPEHAAGDVGFPAGTTVIRPRVQQAELEADGQRMIDFFAGRSPEDKALLDGAQIKKADILFDKEYRLDLGDVSARLLWYGPAHTRGDELVLVEPDRVLFSGDVVQNKAGPIFTCTECTPQSWLAVLQQVAALLPRTVVPDHSDSNDGALVEDERGFMTMLVNRTRALKAEGKSADETAATVTAELGQRYGGWTSMARIGEGIKKAYAAP